MAKPWKTVVVLENGRAATLVVDINWDALAHQLARQAARNKSRKTTMAGRVIKARLEGGH